MLTITNEDNMVMMARYADKHFDLAIVDPPYGIGIVAPGKRSFGKRSGQKLRTQYKSASWDNEIPSKEYFDELFRVSKHQIIWGANYFTKHLPGAAGWIVWDKNQSFEISFAMAELAYTSFKNTSCKICYHSRGTEKKIHPTQKPVYLYKWLLTKYLDIEGGGVVLDTHLGSGSIAIACHDLNVNLVACELDTDYYNAAMKRISNHVAQQKLF